MMRRSAIVMVVLVSLVRAAWGQDLEKKPLVPAHADPTPLPLTATGTVSSTNADLTPGDQAPDFRLDSSLGGVTRRADLRGRWSVLVFDESRTQLAALGVVGDSIRAMGVQPFGVCRDGVGALKTFALREKIVFPLLSDPTGEISQLFGMYDDDHRAIQSGIVIVDAQGVVRMVLQGSSLHADEVLQLVKHAVRGT